MWSGTDYLKNITGFTKNPTSSTEWSINGERCLKLTKTGTNWNDYISESMIDDLPIGNYRFSCQIYSPHASGRIMAFLSESNISQVTFSASENIQPIIITITNEIFRGFRMLNDTLNESIYFDDFKVTAQ